MQQAKVRSAPALPATRGAFRRQLPLVVWLGTLAVAIVALLLLGDGPLATRALTEPGTWSAWLADREPVVAVAALLRLVVLAVAWYLVGVTSVSLVAHLARAARLVRIADALSVPIVRRVVQQAVGVTLAGAVLSSTAGGVAASHSLLAAGEGISAAAPTDGIEMVALDAGDGTTTLAMTRESTEAGVATMALLPDATPTPGATAVEHVVVAGDHLWSIAEDTLTAAWGRAPTDAEVEPYWRAVIEANRDILATPDDPDLLFPGQVVELPEPPTAPA